MGSSTKSELHGLLRRQLQDAIYTAAVIKGIDELDEYKSFCSRESSNFLDHLQKQVLAKMQFYREDAVKTL